MREFCAAHEVDAFADDLAAEEARMKKLLTDALIEFVKELAKNDKFWVVKDTTRSDPIGGKKYFGWRIAVPLMDNE